MGIFRRKVPHHYIPIHPDNIRTKNWVVLLEAGTIVGSGAEKLRVAQATLEKRIKTKYNIFLRKKHFLVLEGYDPRIHALYFCPQLYKSDEDNTLVPLAGDEIGQLIAVSVQEGVVEKQPWYEALDKLPSKPIIERSLSTGIRLQLAAPQKGIEAPIKDHGQPVKILERQPAINVPLHLDRATDGNSIGLQSPHSSPRSRQLKPSKQEDADEQEKPSD